MPSRIFQYLSGAALGALTALTLTACQQDQPTSPSNGSGTDGEEIIDFELNHAVPQMFSLWSRVDSSAFV